jgi:hypothetical protein
MIHRTVGIVERDEAAGEGEEVNGPVGSPYLPLLARRAALVIGVIR